jgi:imidazolonepropionase-like amidohydrolase
MMVDAGFTPEQALLSATGVTADCINLAGEVGTLVPGAMADFLVLNADPLQDIRNTRQVHSIRMGGGLVR